MSAGSEAGAAKEAASVTRIVVQLKLSLLRNGLRQSGGRRAAYVVSAVVVVLFGALQRLGLCVARVGFGEAGQPVGVEVRVDVGQGT